jgi:hypothetical protein
MCGEDKQLYVRTLCLGQDFRGRITLVDVKTNRTVLRCIKTERYSQIRRFGLSGRHMQGR